eukprot:1706651-Amphidinium_carterae.2
MMFEALETLTKKGHKEPETLEELLFGSTEEDASKLGGTTRGSSNLTRLHAQIEHNPSLFIELFNTQVKALGPWSRRYRNALERTTVRGLQSAVPKVGNTYTNVASTCLRRCTHMACAGSSRSCSPKLASTSRR